MLCPVYLAVLVTVRSQHPIAKQNQLRAPNRYLSLCQRYVVTLSWHSSPKIRLAVVCCHGEIEVTDVKTKGLRRRL